MKKRTRTVWTAHHTNGWDTHIVQTDRDKFGAWAAPRGIHGMTEYVDLDEPSARAAALRTLERRTGHRCCTPDCSSWEPHPDLNQ